MEKVSVIIPTFNRLELLLKAVESVMLQTYPVIEIIICDDGSTDNTAEEISKIKDSRIIYLPLNHSGRPAPARNAGIIKSSGTWLAFLDSDDTWHPEKIRIQIAGVQSSGLLAACSNAYRIKENNKSLFFESVFTRINFSTLLNDNKIICSSSLIHRTLIEKVTGFPEEPAFRGIEDYALWLRVAALTEFQFCNEPLVNYLDLPASSIRKDSQGYFNEKRRILLNLKNWLLKNGTSSQLETTALAEKELLRERNIAKKENIKTFIKKLIRK